MKFRTIGGRDYFLFFFFFSQIEDKNRKSGSSSKPGQFDSGGAQRHFAHDFSFTPIKVKFIKNASFVCKALMMKPKVI